MHECKMDIHVSELDANNKDYDCSIQTGSYAPFNEAIATVRRQQIVSASRRERHDVLFVARK